ncbi:MAG: hypothetical protein WC446_03095 [Candidatus Paceibacterota bacterium]|jgi:hypothetical protein
MENKEKISDNKFENLERKETNYSSQVFEQPKEEKKEKTLEEIFKNNFENDEKKNTLEQEINPEKKEAIIKAKESQGASIGKISSIINKIKKKFSPYGIDEYHDELTKRKDDQ